MESDERPASSRTTWRHSFDFRASAVLLAISSPYFGVQVCRAGEWQIVQGHDDVYPIGHTLIVLGTAVIYLLPVVLLIVAFRRRRTSPGRPAGDDTAT